jgi:MFS transporter, ACS family, hexuronate transporter
LTDRPLTALREGGEARAYGSYRWVVLGLATVLQVGVSMPQQTPAAIGPILTRELGLSRSELGLLTSAIWGGMLLGMLPSGVLADRFGERRVIAVGATLLGLVLLLAAQAPTFWWLFGLLLLAAFGSSSASPGGTKAIASWFPPHQRGLAMGVRQMGVTAAGVIASVLLPPIAVAAHWEAAFRTVAAIVLGVTVVFALVYRESAPHPTLPRQAGGGVFRDLLRNRTFVFGTAYAWVFMGALGSAVTYLGVAMHQEVGVSAIVAGYLLAVLQVGGIAGRIGWGLLSDRLHRRGPAMLACGVMTLAVCALMAFVRGPVALPLVALLAFLLGLAAMGWNALYLTLVSDQVPIRSAATAIGAGLTISFSGMFIATPIFGLIADRSGSYELSWLALAAWAVVGTLLGLGIRERTSFPRA